jgi:SAM-dependent methyltransferase
MKTGQGIEAYLDAVINERFYSRKGRLQYHMETVFEGIDFKNKRVLDIGGGGGLHSFYAASCGASKVVCLEPDAEGSSSGVSDRFHRLEELLEHSDVELKLATLQTWEPEGQTFDVILLHDSINHLDEEACTNLLRDSRSKAVYHKILSKIYSLSSKGAKLVICDCSRQNFFALLKIHNPFAPTIEWHKHQAPEVWARLLSEIGFVNPRVKWSSFNASRNWGRVLMGNRLVAYFLRSHFCLTMDRP